MPLDATTYASPSDPAALYRERRERAVALWLDVPPERFDMSSWKDQGCGCGSTACALGWLADRCVDGWKWKGVAFCRAIPTWRDLWSVSAAAEYFALGECQARTLFGNSNSRMTATEVGGFLLFLGYTIPLTPEPLPCR